MLLQVDRYCTACFLRAILPAGIIWHPGIMSPDLPACELCVDVVLSDKV